ncbi:MAG: DUF1343 domain-containing protein [Gemmatimonadetes bacterium]|nr:DUF1343 domain-containing protein [Gemmatimonadota bacterium]
MSMAERRARRRSISRATVVAAAALGILACGSIRDRSRDGALGGAQAETSAVRTPQPKRSGPVLVGIDVLLRDSLALVRGKRVGLLTNHTGVSATGASDTLRSSVDVLHARTDFELVALYSPEHGIAGDAGAGEKIAAGRHQGTGLPIYSLYGETMEPLPYMLAGIDVLLFDIQDIGARYYTYVWSMALAMRAAGAAGIPFVVLDRPNPIGGALVQGNVLDTAFATFVGLYPVPMRHGMSEGEVARMLVGEFGVKVDLHVVPTEGWGREQWYDETGLAWIPPSPNMPSLESAAHYPGTCLFEGTNLSVGRGSNRPFQWVGAPWLDGAALAERLNRYGLPGVRFEPATFTPQKPGDAKWPGEEVHGVRFVMTDRAVYDPTRAAVAALVEARALSGDRWRWNVAHIDRLAGTDRLRRMIDQGASADEVTASWAGQLEAFQGRRAGYLIYR